MFPANYTIRLIDVKDLDLIKNVFSSYPIFDESYRQTLNNKIINHYLYEEIGQETPALFSHYLQNRLNEIMPKYNKLYESEIFKVDPLSNYHITETLERTGTGESNSNSDSTNTVSLEQNTDSKQNHVYQNTPQADLAHEDIDNYSYATTHDMESNTENVSSTKGSSTNMTDSTSTNTTEKYTKTLFGIKDVELSTVYKNFINNFIDLDNLIINDLKNLFMQIY